jgi:hypothetical protein
MEDGGVVDAAVILMAREGLIGDAMKRLTEHLGKLEGALTGLLQSNDQDMHPDNLEEAAEVLLESLQKYTGVGIWLCKKNSKSTSGKAVNGTQRRKSAMNTELNPQESLWLELIDAVVQITKNISSSLLNLDGFQATNLDGGKLLFSLRSLVQTTFTALLTATSGPSGGNISFLRILRAFLTRASVSSPTITDLRAVLTSIFSAYAYEESILGLANRLLDKDLFVNVDSASHLRKRGWRPRGSVCEGCHRRTWGPGVAGDVLGRWEGKQAADAIKREERWLLKSGAAGRGKERAKSQDGGNMDGKGKAKAFDGHEDDEDRGDGFNGMATSKVPDLGPLVVFACRHLYHRQCLEAALAKKAEGTWREPAHDGREFRCPIDG